MSTRDFKPLPVPVWTDGLLAFYSQGEIFYLPQGWETVDVRRTKVWESFLNNRGKSLTIAGCLPLLMTRYEQ